LAAGNPPSRWLEGIVVQHSDDGGRTWSPGVLVGKNGRKHQDKPWAAVDPRTGRIALVWTEFDKYGSKNPAHKSRLLVSFSDDRGLTWTDPLRINDRDGDCADDDFTVEGGVPLFDDEGNIYVVWAFDRRIWFDYSLDGGRTWHTDRPIADQEAGWNFDIPGLYRANGLPVFLGDDRGRFYVIFGDKSEAAMIKILVSDDRGRSWEGPFRLPHQGRDQFFPAAAWDAESERLFVLHYDRSRTEGNWTETKLSIWNPRTKRWKGRYLDPAPFLPHPSVFFGDYIGIDAFGGRIAGIWTFMKDKSTRIRAAVLTPRKNRTK